ncbi:MAG: heat shock protein HspQ [Deltaproteobacteria bacterium]|nr:heat shock protein HspQ [Deltaproteobacteria bacterium]MBW2723501.1 heat shock protein HspQ [Deltaproteobacteria bacterium]
MSDPSSRQPTSPASSKPEEAVARFSPGELVHHARFGYRGVVVDVDATFQLSDEWYEEVARSRPPKDRPWYHVLVDGSTSTTYVAERHLETDSSLAPIRHPLLEQYFRDFCEGRYVADSQIN